MIFDMNRGDHLDYTILDGNTAQCLDGERIFYADSDRGFYRRYLVDKDGASYVWDRRTKQRANSSTPEKFQEAAWETVRRPIAIFKKGDKYNDEETIVLT
jgi:hypothetical protein